VLFSRVHVAAWHTLHIWSTTDRKAVCQRLKVQAPAPQAVPVGRMSSAATNALRRVLTQAPKAARSVQTSSARAGGHGHSTGVSRLLAVPKPPFFSNELTTFCQGTQLHKCYLPSC